MTASDIVVRGAREHNLRDVGLVIPRNQLVCFTGVSGSGKSSLAFDTLYAEGQRRYVESLSSYARQFLGQMPKPEVDWIGGLSPSISISQKSAGSNPRSTVGTITEIYDFLRVLYARVGTAFCPECQQPISAQTRDQIMARILAMPPGQRCSVLAPIIRGQKGAHRELLLELRQQGFARARVDGQVIALGDDLQLDRRVRHDIELVIDRLTLRGNIRPRLAEAVDLALKIGKGTMILSVPSAATEHGEATEADVTTHDTDVVFSVDYSCAQCGLGFSPPTPQTFSFNSPQGMCPDCDGLGTSYTFDVDLLIPNRDLSFRAGCIELVGPWKSLSRWRRHVYQGVADTIERLHELPEGALLDSPWRDLPPILQEVWLQGTGDQHITFTWRGGSSPVKYGGKFGGIIPDLLSRYRNAKSRILLARLEPYMRSMTCPSCRGERLHRQARHVKLRGIDPRSISRNGRDAARKTAGSVVTRSLPELCRLSVADAAAFLSTLDLSRNSESDRGRTAERNSRSLVVPAERGAGLPLARSDGPHTVGWRVATNSPGQPDRLRTGGRVVHPG